MIDWFFQKNSNFTKLFKKYLIQQLKYKNKISMFPQQIL